MKIARVALPTGPAYVSIRGEAGAEEIAILSRNGALATRDIPELLAEESRMEWLRLGDAALLAPIVDPGKVIGIGLNYFDHAAEAAMPVPDDPLVFAKFSTAIIGPGDDIVINPDLTASVDAEGELAVVIGTEARDVSPTDALGHVWAYTCLNDVSARDLQERDGQWVRAKSLDTFCPVGPWLVTADEIDPAHLRIRTEISGEVLQDGTTADMIFGVSQLISRLSGAFTLRPGDVIATGTPPGVGWFRSPKRLLRHDDTVTISIDGIGSLSNRVRFQSKGSDGAP